MNEPTSYPILLSGEADMAVPQDDVIYTDAHQFGGVNDFAIVYQVSCAVGLTNVKIQLQQSIDGINWFTPKTIGDIETSLTLQTLQGCSLTPICVPYIRFKITELTDLQTGTIVNMWVVLQKKFGGD